MILDKFSLKDKVAIVTGSNTGPGQGICRAFVEAGALVAGVSRRPSTETSQMLGAGFHNIIADLSSSSVADGIIAQTVNRFGRVDILVNNASLRKRCDSREFPEENRDSGLNVNVKT